MSYGRLTKRQTVKYFSDNLYTIKSKFFEIITPITYVNDARISVGLLVALLFVLVKKMYKTINIHQNNLNFEAEF